MTGFAATHTGSLTPSSNPWVFTGTITWQSDIDPAILPDNEPVVLRLAFTTLSLTVDGVLKSGTLATSGSWPGSDFSNSSLFLMSRGASTLFAAGRMCGVSVHHSILSGERIAAHYAGA